MASNLCPTCGHANLPTNNFCLDCGTPLTAPVAAPTGPPSPYPVTPPPAYGYPPLYPSYGWPLTPRATLSEMISAMFRVWTQNFVNFFVVYLALTLVTSLIGAVVSFALLGTFSVSGLLPGLTSVIWSSLVAILVTVVITLVLNSIVIGGMTEYAVRRFRGEPVTLQQALRRGLSRFLSILGANALLTLILYALVLIPLILMIPVALFGANLATVLTGLCLLFVWLLIGVIVAVYLSVSLGLYAPAIMMENATALGGLSRSWRMVKGHWLSLFGAVLVVGILASVITLSITFATGIVRNPVVGIIGTALAAGIVGSWSVILYAVAYELILREPQLGIGTPPPYYAQPYVPAAPYYPPQPPAAPPQQPPPATPPPNP